MLRNCFFTIVLAVLLAPFVAAQVTRATISGTVSDESGAVLPGVSITAKNLGTGIAREVISDDAGRYEVPNLSLGAYEVTAELAGFQTAVRGGITLTIGREAVVNFSLKVGEISEKVTVTGEAPLVETARSEVSDLVSTQKIEDLPLNGRSYTQLALLQAGVTTLGSGGFGSVSGGGAKLSVAGTRSTNTFFYLDGTDIKGMFGHTPGSAGGQTLGVETIREFSVLVSSFSAEYGGSGGVINSVTKSGTNEVHGSVFEFLRNSSLDARNFFDKDVNPPPFKRNQFGFTVGGPIRKDQTFFFGSYEGLRERLTTTTIVNVPDAATKSGLLPTGPVNIHPEIRRYLDAMPLPNGRIFNNGSGEFIWAAPRPLDENYLTVKVDHQFSPSDSVFVRYTFDDADQINPLSFPQFTDLLFTRYQYVTIEENKILSPRWLNTFRFGLNRSVGGDVNRAEGLDASLNVIKEPGRIPPTLASPVISGWGPNTSGDRFAALNSFQFTDKMTYTAGRHSIRMGADVTRYQYNGATRSRVHGQVRFNTYRDFLEGRVFIFEFMVPGTGDIRGIRQNGAAFYIQDDFKVRPNLTLNLGLRWEFVTIPNEVAGRISNVRDPLRDTASTVGDPFFMLPKDNLGPRFGFAWDPTGSGRTSVRGGFGLFHQQMTYIYWRLPSLQNDPFFMRAQVRGPLPFPPPVDVISPTLQPGTMQFEMKTPYVMHYNLTLQRELPGETVVAVSYVGSRGVHLGRFFNMNVAQFIIRPDGTKFWPVNSPRINPAFGSTDVRQFDTNSLYSSFQLRIQKRFRQGLQFQGSYTWARAIDEASNQEGLGGGGWDVTSMDPYDRSRDRALSSWDLRHNLVFNFTYDLPGARLLGPVGQVFGGWKTSGIANIHTGTPSFVALGFNRSRNLNITTTLGTPDRPNLKPGANNNPVLGGPDRYLDPAPFEVQEAGTLGNLGRNTIIAPGLATFDFSLVKNFTFTEWRHLEFRGELFNLFNRANFGPPNGTVFTSAAAVPSGSFGRISQTTTTARQIQFALKLRF